MGIGVVRSDSNRLAISGFRLGIPPQPSQHDPQLVLRLEVVRPDLQDRRKAAAACSFLFWRERNPPRHLAASAKSGAARAGLERGRGFVEPHALAIRGPRLKWASAYRGLIREGVLKDAIPWSRSPFAVNN